MNAIFVIAGQTIRSAVRSRTVHVLLFFSALTVFVLPLTLQHDGTAKGLVQISITYTLGITGILLSLCAVWLGATLTAEDIEGYQLHMVVSKPVGRFQILLGKWSGVVALLGGLLVLNCIVIYGMCHLRLYRGGFDKAELAILHSEVMIGRRIYKPVPIDMDAWSRRELRSRMALGLELPPNVGESTVLDSLRSQLTQSSESIEFNKVRPWVFKGLPKGNDDDILFLNYRIFVERAKKKNQRNTEGLWFVYNPEGTTMQDVELVAPVRDMGGVTRTLRLSSRFVSSDGELRLRYQNLDPQQQTVVVQEADGPFMMIGSVSFINNYLRVCTLLFLQVMFMATLGCVTGASLSTPMAVFVSFAYVFFGLLVRYIRVNQEGVPDRVQENILYLIFEKIGDAVQACTFSLNEYVEIGALIDGRLIEMGMVAASTTALIFFRALPILVIGLVAFYKRELGLVIRK